jgi:hypothetical protein
MANVEPSENKQRMLRGDMYIAFTPELGADRDRCKKALRAFNAASGVSSRRELVRLWRE